ncbi:hypothetical protein T4C_12616 [Trichinella pseudospiralis]|uniref:Uncharacterized protein n=1 Tax=Trichinella pseudospiralis TaxID=6337 RepID=A0A0V1GBV7_TRIPS|nr:hypothetical protein T4C_12616 [Trichinella pseudospiralis]
MASSIDLARKRDCEGVQNLCPFITSSQCGG